MGFSVPAGRRLFVLSQRVRLSENSYLIEPIIAENGFTGGTICGKNPLDEGANPNLVQSELYRDVTPDGAITVLSPRDILDAGSTTASSRSPATSLESEMLQSWISSPMVRITRESGGAPYRMSFNATVYERVE